MTSEHNDQTRHYESKLAYEIDSWDLSVALSSDALIVVVDAAATGVSEAAEHQQHYQNKPHPTLHELPNATSNCP